MKFKWSKERCAEEASKYISRSEFEKNCGSAVNSARDNGWLDEICSHMTRLHKPNNYWTKEKCAEEALKYKTRGELKKYDFNVYHLIIFRKLYSFLDHMEWNGNTTYNLEEVIEECRKYKTRRELREKNRPLYFWVCVNDHKEICFSHMKNFRKRKWDINEAIEISKKYTYIADFKKNDICAYHHLVRNGYDIKSYLKIKPRELKERKCVSCGQTPNEVSFYKQLASTCRNCYNKKNRKINLNDKCNTS